MMQMILRILGGCILIGYGIYIIFNPQKMVEKRKAKDEDYEPNPHFYSDTKIAGAGCILVGLYIVLKMVTENLL